MDYTWVKRLLSPYEEETESIEKRVDKQKEYEKLWYEQHATKHLGDEF